MSEDDFGNATALIKCTALNSSSNMSEIVNCTESIPRVYDSGMSLIVAVQIVLYTYVLPLIVIVGLVGNVTSIYLIMADKQMRNVSSSVYLLAVLSSDTGMLLSLFLVWLEALGYPVNHHPIVCRVNVYWTYVCGFLSIWYVVCITVETFITICHPTKIKQMCTVFRARMVAILLLITALWLYVEYPIITQVQTISYPGINQTRQQCLTLPRFKELETVAVYADSIMTLIAPFIVLIILLTLITSAIIQSIQKKKNRSIRKSSDTNGGTSKLPQVRVAKMLFVLSVSMVVLSAPSHVIRLKSLFMKVTVLSVVEGLIHLISMFVSYASFSAKFFICIACSKNFRKLFIAHCCCAVKKYHTVPQTMDTAV